MNTCLLCIVLQISSVSALQVDAEQKLHFKQGEGWIPNGLNQAGHSVSCTRDDGFGSQYQCKMAALAIARRFGQCYLFTPFAEYGFHEDLNATDFTGMTSDKSCIGSQRWKLKSSSDVYHLGHPDEFFTNEVREELRAQYVSTPKPEIDETCEVAFHIRNGDVSNEMIYNIIQGTFAKKKVCIISEGKSKDFGKVRDLSNVEFKQIREFLFGMDVKQAFHQLVSAPELVMAPSSYSYAAGILNKGQVYYVKPFWHKMLKDWKLAVPEQHIEPKFLKLMQTDYSPLEPLAQSDLD